MKYDGIIFTRNTTIGFRPVAGESNLAFFYKKSGKAIEIDGHSKTNMAYAADGRVLLACDGQVWTAPKKRTAKDPKNRVVFQLTVADLESAAGRDLPDEAIERFADCFGYSSVNESIENVLDSILIDYPEDDED